MVQPPSAPAHRPHGLRGDYTHAAADYTVSQNWEHYSPQEHEIWATLYRRQLALVERYAADEFLAGERALGDCGRAIPRFDVVNQVLESATGWQLVAVPGLIPDAAFFDHLAHRRFPVTVWIRRREELDYLVEPDVFHDFFGHVPLLTNAVFARFLQAYGQAGPKALTVSGGLAMLSRLYWYLVEFGLIRTHAGLRAYGAGILSSKGETVYSVQSDVPQRLRFDLIRVMRTGYRIDEFQHTYFVLERFEQLFDACYDTDFAPLYARYAAQAPLAADARLSTDVPVPRGSPAPAHHYQAGEYGEGGEQQATGVGPRSAGASSQILNDQHGYADRYGNVARGRYGVHGYSSSPGYPGSYPPESRAPAQPAVEHPQGDERLRERICERLTQDPGIDASDITVEVSGGRVTLTGTVDTRHTKYEVEQCVENCGASEIRNELGIG